MIVNLTLFPLNEEMIARGAVNVENKALEHLKMYLDPENELFRQSPNTTGWNLADLAFNNGRPRSHKEPRPTHALVAADEPMLSVIEQALKFKRIQPIRYFQNT